MKSWKKILIILLNFKRISAFKPAKQNECEKHKLFFLLENEIKRFTFHEREIIFYIHLTNEVADEELFASLSLLRQNNLLKLQQKTCSMARKKSF